MGHTGLALGDSWTGGEADGTIVSVLTEANNGAWETGIRLGEEGTQGVHSSWDLRIKR